MMTKKNYIAIAGTFAALLHNEERFEVRQAILACASDLAVNVLSPDNPHFDYARFMAAVDWESR